MKVSKRTENYIHIMIAACDIENLICYGAPYDEYKAESAMIVNLIKRTQGMPDPDAIETIISDVFKRNFGKVYRSEAYPKYLPKMSAAIYWFLSLDRGSLS